MDPAAYLVAALDAAEAKENRRRTWTKDYFGAACPACGERVEGVGITDTGVEPCGCYLTREQYDELSGAVPAPDQEVLRMVEAHRKIAALHAGEHECPMDNGYTYVLASEACETLKLLAQAYGWVER